jgi:hypothetical protein
MKLQINWYAFIIAFVVGMIYIYLREPDVKVFTKFPSPVNAGKVVYVDHANNCYTYIAREMTCPADENLIEAYPVQ